MIDLLLCWMIVGSLVAGIGFSVHHLGLGHTIGTTGWQRSGWIYSVYIFLLFAALWPFLAYKIWGVEK